MMAEKDVVEDCPLNEKYPISTENEDAKAVGWDVFDFAMDLVC